MRIALFSLTLVLCLAASFPASAAKDLRIIRVTPAGQDVPPGRQVVIEFNRPVVPLGRMDRTDAETGVIITPPVACEWRWLNTSALACQLGEKEKLAPATQYKLTVEPRITAEDGAQVGEAYTHAFTTRRPRVQRTAFRTWRAPGHPVIRVVFDQPVTQSSAAAHLFLTVQESKLRRPVVIRADVESQEVPSYLPVPGEKSVLRIFDAITRKSDDAATKKEGEEARRVWLAEPVDELPPDANAALRIEPGLVSAEGPERGVESRDVVTFRTFPAFRFAGVSCTTNADEQVLITPETPQTPDKLCSPLRGVALTFTAPVLRSEVKTHAGFRPDLANGRTDYDPWGEENRDHTFLRMPHGKDRTYNVYLPLGLKAAQTYTLHLPGPQKRSWWREVFSGRKHQAFEDEFSRQLPAPVEMTFSTDHRKPNFELVHNDAVLESGVDSEVPLYVNNLDKVTMHYYRSVAAGSAREGRTASQDIPDVEDVQFAVPLNVRGMLDGKSGALYGHLATEPAVDKGWDGAGRLFAQVTPWQVHIKLGHFRSLAWVTSMTDGSPVEGAKVTVYEDAFTTLSAPGAALDTATTDESGVAAFGGTEKFDADRELSGSWRDEQPRLFLRIQKGEDIAIVPAYHAYEIYPGYVSDYHVYPDSEKRYGHMKAWGMTAQGIYRAGDTMQYKIYLRDQDNETFVPPPGAKYTIVVTDPHDNDVETVKDVKFSRFGAFDGEYAIPETAAVGWYAFRIEADFGGDKKLNRTLHPMRVLVSDFTPAPFRVSTTLNGDFFRPGDGVSVETAARLHSGGPYADAEARVTVTLKSRGFRSSDPVAGGFYFDSNDGESDTEQLWQKSGVLDGAGNFTEGWEMPARPIVYGTIEAESAVRDDRGKSIASVATAKYAGVDRLVGIKSDSWVYPSGKVAEIGVLVVDDTGKPVEGVPVTGVLERETVHTAKVKGAGNAYLSDITVTWEKKGECSLTSGAEGKPCAITPGEAGSYRLTARIKDTKGRTHKTQLYLYVTGGDYVQWNNSNDLALPLVPEQAEYKVGDTARYLVKNPWPGATALVTIERYGVIDSFTQKLEGSTPVISFPVKPDYLPGFYLSVVVASPRVEAPPPEKGQVDMGKPALRMGYARVPVRDPYKEMLVEAHAEKEVYRPRDTVNVTLNAKPRHAPEKAQPVELAVAVLDEAVFDLIAAGSGAFDPYDGFYGLDGLDLRNYNLLTRLVGRQKFEKKGANPGGDGGSDIGTRNIFKYVSYWNPSVPVDAEGNAKISFDAPDNLTGWRVLALAVTPGDRMGLGEGTFKVNRPVELRPVMPNQVREDDSFKAGFSVMNRTDKERTLTIHMAASGDLKDGAGVEKEEKVTLGPYKRDTVYMDVAAGLLPPERDRPKGEIAFTAKAWDGEESDGMEWNIPVLKSRVFDVAANYATTTEDTARESIAFPEGIHTDVGEVSLVLSPSVLGSLEGAFRYIRDYPYPCWEQVLTRGVMAAHYRDLKKYLKDDFKWEDSDTLPDGMLKRAANYQAPNGGMTYFIARDEYADPYLSAYTAIAFGWLREAGYEIPSAVEDKLHGYLQNFLRRDVAPTFYSEGMTSSVRAVALAALVKAGKAKEDDVRRYRPHLGRMGLFGKAHFMQAALRFDATQDAAREAADMIFASGNETGGKFMFSETYDDGYARILATPLRDNCAALDAFMDYAGRKEGKELVGDKPFKLVRMITQTREGRDYWENTQENMFCMAALVHYARVYESETPDMTVTAEMDGKEFGKASFQSLRDPAVTVENLIQEGDAGRKTAVEITREGRGRLYYATRLRYAAKAGFDESVNAGIEVRREYSVRRDGKWELLRFPAEVERGEVVRVDLYLSLPSSRNFVVVDDPLPGGLETVNTDLATASKVDDSAAVYEAAGGAWWFKYRDWQEYAHSRWSFYHRELRHDAARFYADWLPAGNYHLSYTAQAVAEGSFAMLPVGASEMYDPDVYGRGVQGVLKVGPHEAAP